MQKLLVTGASGFLGWNICCLATTQWDVVGVFNNNEIPLDGITKEHCDISDNAKVADLFYRHKPDAVIHAAALPDPNFCQLHPEQSKKINIEASRRIAVLCKKLGARCAFTSSDLVFNGENPPYSEQCATNPENIYGKHKADAEKLMQTEFEDMLICRMPLMFGDHPGPAKSFIQPWIQHLIDGKELRLFTDEFRTPVSAKDAARGILLLIQNESGIFHLGGKSRISRFDFGSLLAHCLGIKNPRIKQALQKDVAMPAPRPKDVSLDSSKAFAKGYDPDEPENALLKLDCVRWGKRSP